MEWSSCYYCSFMLIFLDIISDKTIYIFIGWGFDPKRSVFPIVFFNNRCM